MPKWSRQHEQLRMGVMEHLEERVSPFEANTPSDRRRRMNAPLLEWCALYLPHYFDAPFAPFHQQLVEGVGRPGMPTFIGAFRGAGKSALFALARPLRRLLDGDARYIVYGSQVQKLAAQNMDYVRLELQHNPRILTDYGGVEISGPQTEWTARLCEAGHTVKLEAFGTGMSPRGRRFGEMRPQEFIGDDLEDAELARNPEREANLWDWLMDEVLPALEPGVFAFTVLGTMFGPQCMLQRARQLAARRDSSGRPLGELLLQKAVEEGHSVWPERFPDAALQRVRETVGLRNWLRNYTLDPDDPTRPFQARWLGTYDPATLDVASLDIVAFLDPALSQSGCPRALVTVGADRRSGRRYVLDAWIERGTPLETLRQLFDVHERRRPRLIGIEENGGYALIRPLLAVEEERRGRRLPVRYIHHSRPKPLRIEALCSAFEAGRWLFPTNPSAGIRTLQEQFLSYPDGYVDGPDAAAGCEELLPGFGLRQNSGGAYRSLSRRTDFSAL